MFAVQRPAQIGQKIMVCGRAKGLASTVFGNWVCLRISVLGSDMKMSRMLIDGMSWLPFSTR